VSTTHRVDYSASPHPSSMQHHNELQTAVCGSVVLGHLLSMRVIETTDRRSVNWHYWSDQSAATCCAWCPRRRRV